MKKTIGSVIVGTGVLVGIIVLNPLTYSKYILPPKGFGVVDFSVTSKDLCDKSYRTSLVRPSSSYTTQLKIKQLHEMGYPDLQTKDYEEDHVVSLELGGSPTDPNNLWPQPYFNKVVVSGKTYNLGAREKDRSEGYLHDKVCNGNMSLTDAQNEIKSDWTKAYFESLGYKVEESVTDN